jgi:hypothetical protein
LKTCAGFEPMIYRQLVCYAMIYLMYTQISLIIVISIFSVMVEREVGF